MTNQPEPYRCATCGKDYPVRCMARDCEQRHTTNQPREQRP